MLKVICQIMKILKTLASFPGVAGYYFDECLAHALSEVPKGIHTGVG